MRRLATGMLPLAGVVAAALLLVFHCLPADRAEAVTTVSSPAAVGEGEVDPALLAPPRLSTHSGGPLARRAAQLAGSEDVRVQLEHFLTHKREDVRIALERSTRYLEHMRPLLEEEGVPGELAYLCLIESGFNPVARSHARAVGLWQLMSATASRFGVRSAGGVDERLDFVSSTRGAARYLAYLKERFHDWDLVLAAYNSGEGRVRRAMAAARAQGREPLFENLRLPRETRIFVPAFYAGLLVALQPERYGLFIQYQQPLDYRELALPGGVTFRALARELGCAEEQLALLNPSLTSGRIPPGEDARAVRVPCSVEQYRLARLQEALSAVRWVSYRVRRGDTLWDISRRFDVSMGRIVRSREGLRPASIRPGELLMIPVSGALPEGLRSGENIS